MPQVHILMVAVIPVYSSGGVTDISEDCLCVLRAGDPHILSVLWNPRAAHSPPSQWGWLRKSPSGPDTSNADKAFWEARSIIKVTNSSWFAQDSPPSI